MTAEAVAKIGWSLKSNHHKQIKLPKSVQQTVEHRFLTGGP